MLAFHHYILSLSLLAACATTTAGPTLAEQEKVRSARQKAAKAKVTAATGARLASLAGALELEGAPMACPDRPLPKIDGTLSQSILAHFRMRAAVEPVSPGDLATDPGPLLSAMSDRTAIPMASEGPGTEYVLSEEFEANYAFIENQANWDWDLVFITDDRPETNGVVEGRVALYNFGKERVSCLLDVRVTPHRDGWQVWNSATDLPIGEPIDGGRTFFPRAIEQASYALISVR